MKTKQISRLTRATLFHSFLSSVSSYVSWAHTHSSTFSFSFFVFRAGSLSLGHCCWNTHTYLLNKGGTLILLDISSVRGAQGLHMTVTHAINYLSLSLFCGHSLPSVNSIQDLCRRRIYRKGPPYSLTAGPCGVIAPCGIGWGGKMTAVIPYSYACIYFLLPFNVLTCEVRDNRDSHMLHLDELSPFIHVISNPPSSTSSPFPQIKMGYWVTSASPECFCEQQQSCVSPFISGLMTHLNGMMRIIGRVRASHHLCHGKLGNTTHTHK